MDLVGFHAVVWEPLEITVWSTGTLCLAGGEMRWVQADHMSLPGLSLPLHCRAALQNMPVELGEYRDRGRRSDSEAQLKVWAMNPSDWLLKAVCFEGGRTFSQAGPRKLLFTYKMCQKAELALSALKPTNRHETNHRINRFLCDCSKPKCLKLSAVLTVSGAWFGLLKAECTNGKESSRLSLAC